MAMTASIVKAPATGRVMRSPRHDFQLRHKPFVLQPFLLAPVLPGETIKNLLIQSRAVTSPIRNGLVGWWLEYYIFYVKHRDLDGRDDFSAMMLDVDKDMSAYVSAASTVYNHGGNSINWAQLCLKRVTEEYFRDEGDTWNSAALDGLPMVRINKDGVFNSAHLADDIVTPNDTSLTVGVDDAIKGSEIDALMRTYEAQRAYGFTKQTYEDWLATWGVAPAPQEHHRPELLRFIREWQYPSNTVDPATGAASAAVSWAVAERADKDRFFKEPGFIFGVTCCRPKVYLKNQAGSAAHYLMSAFDWLPPLMSDDPWTSVRRFTDANGPFAGPVTDTDGYVVDMKDLFIHGDSFVNVALDNTTSSVSLPSATLGKYFPTSTDVDDLFVGTAKTLNQDGIVQLNILGRQVDTTPVVRRDQVAG